MTVRSTAWIVALLMLATSVGSAALQPAAKRSATDAVLLDTLVPHEFAGWRELHEPSAAVVNPETRQILDKLYSQIVARTYVDGSGYRIMLSMAYGDDQRGGLQAHRPEVCYPAQGFQLDDVRDGTLATRFGAIDVRHLMTRLGPRNEPVTYWLTVGGGVVRTQFDKRLAQIRLGLTGRIPDGLLFRVSSIDDDPARAFAAQQRFADDLLASVPAGARRQLSGLESAAPLP